MTAQILVVDDVPANVKLLEAKLTNEYYDVITATNGFEAIAAAKQHKPDLILLDVMMPEMDGFTCCAKLKEDPETSHIPVVMVTALSEKADRLRGLEAGADDFLTKPINDIALFARVKSLVRIKMLIDELRLRDKTKVQMGLMEDATAAFNADVSGARIFVIDDDALQVKKIVGQIASEYVVESTTSPETCQNVAIGGNFDLFIISGMMLDADGLRLASHFKSNEETRHTPVILLVDEDDQRLVLKSLEMGVNDYVLSPIDVNELQARIRTQIRRKRYQEALRATYQQSVSMAVTDGLTGLYNRHYLNTHLDNMVRDALATNKPLSLMILDMDHFKMVNDTYGHDVGDQVLKQLAGVISNSIRSSDLAARFGGEEFVVLMPGTRIENARDVAGRMRHRIETTPFKVTHEIGQLMKTVSVGMSHLNQMGDSAESLLKRADEALYRAKNNGRNRVEVAENL
jgi:two-component system cell cycle response regulator